MNEEKVRNQIKNNREEKDIYFKYSPQSPLPFEKRSSFQGLSYYHVDLSLRFNVKLYEHEDKEIIKVQDNKGGTQQYLQWGEFRFEIEGETMILQAYKRDSNETRLWVPFRDKTSGEETYGGGRYIDLVEERHKIKDGKWILDLNTAYNPFCAYSENYVCPFIPPKNWLQVRIEAGEKAFEK